MDLYDYASEMTVKAPAGMILFHIGECPRVLVLNPEGQRILGMDAAGLNRSLASFMDASFLSHLRALPAETDEQVEVHAFQNRYLLFRSRNIGNSRILSVFTDTTDQEAARRSVILSSRQDSLTELLNRRTFQEEVDRVIGEKPGLSAFIMVDLDNFKQVNDTYGHLVGDDVLVATAKKLRAQFRSEDLVARIGGDEFSVFMLNIPSVEYMARRAGQLVDKLRYSFRQGGRTVTVSVGVSFYPRDGESFPQLYACADEAMYRAKQNGRNCFALCPQA